jgi:hypothetical protein
MPKVKERSSDEFYKGRIKELEKEVRNLKKQLRQLQKQEHFYNNKDLDEPETVIEPKKERCKECSKGFMEELNVLDRIFKRCLTCGHRTRARKANNGKET